MNTASLPRPAESSPTAPATPNPFLFKGDEAAVPASCCAANTATGYCPPAGPTGSLGDALPFGGLHTSISGRSDSSWR
jgi:hypothetical protein